MYFVIYFFILCFVSGAVCFFVKHVQIGMCINDTSVLETDASWGNLTFVELSNNCLDPAAQSRFLDNSAMFNLKTERDVSREQLAGMVMVLVFLPCICSLLQSLQIIVVIRTML